MGLPFLPQTKEASVSVPSESKLMKTQEDSGSDSYGLESCADELIKAVHSKDIKATAQALKDAFYLLDSEPHDEGPHTNG